MLTTLLTVKLVIILALLIFFYYTGKAHKGVILGVLLYIAIPTPDDIITIPFITIIDKLPLWMNIILYYGIAWILIISITIYL